MYNVHVSVANKSIVTETSSKKMGELFLKHRLVAHAHFYASTATL